MKIKRSSTPSSSTPKKTKERVLSFVNFLGLKGFSGIILATIFIIFCFQNIESTSVHFLFWEILEVSKLNLIAISTFSGVIIGILVGYHYIRRDNINL